MKNMYRMLCASPLYAPSYKKKDEGEHPVLPAKMKLNQPYWNALSLGSANSCFISGDSA